MSVLSPPVPPRWLAVHPAGLYVAPADLYIDPTRAVPRAVVTHGHADHARPGHDHVLATPETLAIMAARLGDRAGHARQTLALGEALTVGGVTVRLAPAGHVLGSAQVVLDHQGCRVVVSGDYKRAPDPTCAAFEPVPCDVFITEATFGLPVFRHPPADGEIARLLRMHALFPERTIVIGVYALGKCQRVIALLRAAGYDRPIYLHGALVTMCRVYERLGVALGELRPATGADRKALAGEIVLAPPAATRDRWLGRLPDPMIGAASGWMRIRQHVRRSGVELPLVISDHADWDDLTRTIDEVARAEVWVTHGREDALVHYAQGRGLSARALSLVGFDEETGGDADETTPVPDEAAS